MPLPARAFSPQRSCLPRGPQVPCAAQAICTLPVLLQCGPILYDMDVCAGRQAQEPVDN